MKRLHSIKLAMRDRKSRLRRDVIRLTVATAFVGASLTALYGYISAPPPEDPSVAAARLAEAERLEAQEAVARRTGTILFVTFTKLCEEHRFDNATGHTIAIDYVDCDERLKSDSKAKAQGAKAKNMRGMLASFRK